MYDVYEKAKPLLKNIPADWQNNYNTEQTYTNVTGSYVLTMSGIELAIAGCLYKIAKTALEKVNSAAPIERPFALSPSVISAGIAALKVG